MTYRIKNLWDNPIGQTYKKNLSCRQGFRHINLLKLVLLWQIILLIIYLGFLINVQLSIAGSCQVASSWSRVPSDILDQALTNIQSLTI